MRSVALISPGDSLIASQIDGERPETVDRLRGVDGTVDVLARTTEKVVTT